MKNERKHIEEMAWDICDIPRHPSYKSCMDCNCYAKCHAMYYAKRAHDAGYRKQRVGENITENHPVDEFICSECGLITRENSCWKIDEDADGDETQYEFEIKYCPRCGMKVKGGVE